MSDYEIDKLMIYFAKYYLEVFMVPWEEGIDKYHLNLWDMQNGRLSAHYDGIIPMILYLTLKTKSQKK
ncbi:MAG: hypothetical protein QXF88_01335 [Candidatus Aenigmatarchaeota archaeon]